MFIIRLFAAGNEIHPLNEVVNTRFRKLN
jgi:hypothetical protein